ALPSPDYVSSLEYPPSPEVIPEPVYPEYMPPEDEILPDKEQPLPPAVSPSVDSLGYSKDKDEDEEEKHLATGDSTAVALLAVDHASSADQTELFETDESTATPPPDPAYRVTARMSIRPQTPISFPSDIEIARLMAITTPPSSPLFPWSSPLPQIPSTPLLLPVSSLTSPTYPVTDSWDEIVETVHGAPATDETELGGSTMFRDHGVAGSRPQETGTVHRGTKTADETSDPYDRKMVQKRTNRANLTTTTNITTTTMNDSQLKALIKQGVNATLAARDVDRNTSSDDSHVSGTGVRRIKRVTRECTYPDFMKCQPLNFKGTKGVVELTQWFKKMETVFRISNCYVENQIKFSTCTLLGSSLTWWSSHVMTVGPDVAYAITWAYLKKKITNKYCPRVEKKKLEFKLWNLKVKSTDVIGYNQRFQELVLPCVKMFPEESDKIKRYVNGFPDMIHESVVASKPKTMKEVIEMAIELMDKKIRTFAERQIETKRKQGDNQQQQQQNKRQNTRKAYTA
nr:hypothetical protein [Tanacetum cinerariifolium]